MLKFFPVYTKYFSFCYNAYIFQHLSLLSLGWGIFSFQCFMLFKIMRNNNKVKGKFPFITMVTCVNPMHLDERIDSKCLIYSTIFTLGVLCGTNQKENKPVFYKIPKGNFPEITFYETLHAWQGVHFKYDV